MKLCDLLCGVVCDCEKFGDLEIENLTFSSKEKKKNSLFFCLSGASADGHEFAGEAVLNGAGCVICEREVDVDVPQIIVKNTRKALAKISANFFGNPAEKLRLIAVTGTNGKTSTTYIIKSILEQNGQKCGLIGTNGVFIGSTKIAENLTTPDPIFLHGYFRQMVECGCEFVVMEASAHAIFWNKLFGMRFECIALTNLTQDHLDFFGTMENYALVKESFFNKVNGKSFVVNLDDNLGRKIAGSGLKNLSTYALDRKADFRGKILNARADVTEFALVGLGSKFETNLIGRFNVYNCLCSIAVCRSIGLSFDEIRSGLREKIVIPGRFNVICNNKKKNHIIIDYAHTPDGLEKALVSARSVCQGKLICVFGCGGNRDRSKRKIMGAAAQKFADFCVVTSDNPRFEKEEDIILEIVQGMTDRRKFIVEKDREKAIKKAISKSKKGDIVLIAGKGAETYQEIRGERKHFSDFECARKFIS